MARHLLALLALTALGAVPVSARGGRSSADPRWHSSDCKSPRVQDREQAPAARSAAGQAPAAQDSGGGFFGHGWLSFFSRQSSVLLP